MATLCVCLIAVRPPKPEPDEEWDFETKQTVKTMSVEKRFSVVKILLVITFLVLCIGFVWHS
jgi:hypothetical protein